MTAKGHISISEELRARADASIRCTPVFSDSAPPGHKSDRIYRTKAVWLQHKSSDVAAK